MPVAVKFNPAITSTQQQIIPDATVFNDGVMNEDQVAQLNNIAAQIVSDDVAIYVDSVNGLDTNAGTAAAPLKTFDAAVALLPLAWEKSCTIYCAAGDYGFDVANYIFGSPVGSKSAPLLIAGVTVDTGLGTLTTLAGSTSTSYVATAVTTNGALRGASITNVRTGKQARISNNTYNSGTGQTTFTLMTALSVTVGDTFTVTKPDTRFVIPTGFTAGILTSYANFMNIRFVQETEAANFAPLVAVANNAIVGFYNCEIDCGSNSRWLDGAPGSRIVCSSQSNAFGNLPTNPVANTSSGLWLYTDSGGTSTHQFFDYAEMLGTLMLDGSVLSLTRLALGDISTVDMLNSSILLSDGAVAGISTCNATGSNTGQVNTINVTNGSMLNLGAGTIGTSQGAAVAVTNARARLGAVAGTGNATFGIVANLASQVRESGATVTGTSGDTEVGTTVKAYGALPFVDTLLNSIQVG